MLLGKGGGREGGRSGNNGDGITGGKGIALLLELEKFRRFLNSLVEKTNGIKWKCEREIIFFFFFLEKFCTTGIEWCNLCQVFANEMVSEIDENS